MTRDGVRVRQFNWRRVGPFGQVQYPDSSLWFPLWIPNEPPEVFIVDAFEQARRFLARKYPGELVILHTELPDDDD